jgi:hypothetical protein
MMSVLYTTLVFPLQLFICFDFFKQAWLFRDFLALYLNPSAQLESQFGLYVESVRRIGRIAFWLVISAVCMLLGIVFSILYAAMVLLPGTHKYRIWEGSVYALGCAVCRIGISYAQVMAIVFAKRKNKSGGSSKGFWASAVSCVRGGRSLADNGTLPELLFSETSDEGRVRPLVRTNKQLAAIQEVSSERDSSSRKPSNVDFEVTPDAPEDQRVSRNLPPLPGLPGARDVRMQKMGAVVPVLSYEL